MKDRCTKRGFTLLEIMLVVAVIGILFGTSYTVYDNLLQRDAFTNAMTSSKEKLQRAEMLSMASAHDSMWGVRFGETDVTLFKGSSYDGRDQTYDEVESFNYVTASDSEYIFQKVSGEPLLVGTTTLTSTVDNETGSIHVNEKGNISSE